MDASCVPLARVKSCATEYEQASAAVVVSRSSAHLERGGKGCKWVFVVCFWPTFASRSSAFEVLWRGW